jgi:hypothetical protein
MHRPSSRACPIYVLLLGTLQHHRFQRETAATGATLSGFGKRVKLRLLY